MPDVDLRDGCEQEEHEAEDEGHVQGQDQDDRGGEEHFQRAEQALDEDVAALEGLCVFLVGHDVEELRAVEFLPETSGFAVEQDDVVGFGV